MLNKYGLEVKKKLLELGMTQNELCKIVGISKTNLSMILNGHRKGWKHQAKINNILENTKSKRII